MGTWSLVERPAGRNVVGSRWVLHTKTDAASSARLHSNIWNRLCRDFCPHCQACVDPNTARTGREIGLGNLANLIDVRSAYLNGTLDEDVYMAQPPHFALPGKEHLVFKLHKALYGLRQAGRRWHEKLTSVLTSLGFAKCAADHAVFHRTRGSEFFFIPTHVDDLTGYFNVVMFWMLSKTTTHHQVFCNLHPLWEFTEFPQRRKVKT
jgi:hypothetical protein